MPDETAPDSPGGPEAHDDDREPTAGADDAPPPGRSGRVRGDYSTAPHVKTPSEQPSKRGFRPFGGPAPVRQPSRPPGAPGGGGELSRKPPLHLRHYDPEGHDKTQLAPRRHLPVKTQQVREAPPPPAPAAAQPAHRRAPAGPPWRWIGLGAALLAAALVAYLILGP